MNNADYIHLLNQQSRTWLYTVYPELKHKNKLINKIVIELEKISLSNIKTFSDERLTYLLNLFDILENEDYRALVLQLKKKLIDMKFGGVEVIR